MIMFVLRSIKCTQTHFHAPTRVPVVIPSNALQFSNAGVVTQLRSTTGGEAAAWGQHGAPGRRAWDREEIAFRSCAERGQMVCL